MSMTSQHRDLFRHFVAAAVNLYRYFGLLDSLFLTPAGLGVLHACILQSVLYSSSPTYSSITISIRGAVECRVVPFQVNDY